MKKYLVPFAFILYVLPLSSNAQYKVLYDFGDTGQYPTGNLVLAQSKLYGVTSGQLPRTFGNVFSIDSNGVDYKGLWNFGGYNNGKTAWGTPVLFGNKLYGTTVYGGTGNCGTDGCGVIYSVDTNGNNYINLWSFDVYDTVNGGNPYGSLIVVNNKLYGMTESGGRYDSGIIFCIDTNGKNFKDLIDFNGVNGCNPYGSLILIKNRLYGMTRLGGANGEGVIFSIDTAGKKYKILLDFSGANGADPMGSLIFSGKKLYGMTPYGGIYSSGNAFTIDTDGNNYKNLINFSTMMQNGTNPEGSLLLLGKSLYGMTIRGGLWGGGEIFSMDTTGADYNDLHNFAGIDGRNPYGSLIARRNNLYGMTSGGGPNAIGVIFEMDTSTVTSVNNLSLSSDNIKVYPNPNNGVFTIQSSVVSRKSFVEIYNVLGEQVYLRSAQADDNNVNLSNQPNGVYLYRVMSENGELLGDGKFVIVK